MNGDKPNSALEEKVDRNGKDIDELQAKIEGLPEKIDNIEKQIEKLSMSIEKFIDKLGKDYMPKEQCRLCHDNLKIEYDQKVAQAESEIKQNQGDIKLIFKAFYTIGATVILGLLNFLARKMGWL